MLFKKEEYSKWDVVSETTPSLTRCVVVTPWPKDHPFQEGDLVLYLGEISNMKGHISFVGESGRVFFGYHFENLNIIPDDC